MTRVPSEWNSPRRSGGRIGGDEPLLPVLQPHRGSVLAPRTVLREHAGPVLPRDGHDDRSRNLSRVRTCLRLDALHQRGDPTQIAGVATVVDDMESVHPAPSGGDVAVAEIPAEQLAVGASSRGPSAHRGHGGARWVCPRADRPARRSRTSDAGSSRRHRAQPHRSRRRHRQPKPPARSARLATDGHGAHVARMLRGSDEKCWGAGCGS